jgi:hypothetical protein
MRNLKMEIIHHKFQLISPPAFATSDRHYVIQNITIFNTLEPLKLLVKEALLRNNSLLLSVIRVCALL